MIGRTLSHYRVQEALGAGGMGEVYVAEDTRLRRRVALKVIPAAVASDPERVERFGREARALAKLNHPGIVTIHSLEEAEGVHFIIMERVEGETLGELIPPDGLPTTRLLEIGAALADAVAAAHAEGVTHRDIKPANVMVTAEGRVKILDFGLAKLRHGDTTMGVSALATQPVTREGDVLGTLPYMSPEQLEGKAIDHRSDIFSLGAVLYEMATGRRPFAGDSSASLISAILRDTPKTVSDVRDELPAELDRIVRRALAKQPAERLQSAADLRNQLNELLEEERSAKTAAATPPTKEAKRRPRWPLAAAGVAGLAVLAVVAGWLLRGRAVPPAEPGAIRSLAVLPFDNLMNDPAEDYFVEGMHEGLITALARIKALKVISRTSAMRFKGSDKTLPEIAAELGVDAAIEGSVLRAGERVRITAQLIRGASDVHIWASSYDRDVRDVLALISEVAQAIAEEVQAAVTPAERALLADTHQASPEVQDLVFRAHHLFWRLGPESVQSALELHQRAMELDPTYAPPLAGAGACYMLQGLFGYRSLQEAAPMAAALARRALELDPNLSAAHSTLGYTSIYFDWDWSAARESLSRAVELDPTNPWIRHGYADYFLAIGDGEASLEQTRIGREYDPLSSLANAVLVGHLVFARHFEEALKEGERLVELFPNRRGFGLNWMAKALWHLGRHGEALGIYRELYQEQPEALAALERGAAEGGPAGAARAMARLHEARLGVTSDDEYDVASWYGLAGDCDAALQWLERAADQRRPFVIHIKASPDFDALRDDPRFAALLRRVGFPD